MNCSTRGHKSPRMFTWLVLVLGILATVGGLSLADFPELLPAGKRSAMDLAMMQVYGICDGDKNGIFTKRELPCVQRILRILLSGR